MKVTRGIRAHPLASRDSCRERVTPDLSRLRCYRYVSNVATGTTVVTAEFPLCPQSRLTASGALLLQPQADLSHRVSIPPYSGRRRRSDNGISSQSFSREHEHAQPKHTECGHGQRRSLADCVVLACVYQPGKQSESSADQKGTGYPSKDASRGHSLSPMFSRAA